MSKIKKGYDRVTEIIRAVDPDPEFEKLMKSRPEVVENAGKRGTILHLIADQILRGKPISKGHFARAIEIDPKCAEWIKTFSQFANDHQELVVAESALRMYRDKEKITGELDFIIENDFEEIFIADLKTSAKIPKSIKAQLGAYYWLHGNVNLNLCCIHAPMGKKPLTIPYKTKDCVDAWKKILDKHKKLKGRTHA